MSYGPNMYFSGRQIYQAKVTPLVVTIATPTSPPLFSRGTANDLAQSYTIEGMRFSGTVDDAEISSANMLVRSFVSVKDDFEVEITEIKLPHGSQSIFNAWIGAEFFLVEMVVSADGGTSKLIVQAPCKRRSLTDSYGEGKQQAVLVGVPCGLPMAYIAIGGTLAYP